MHLGKKLLAAIFSVIVYSIDLLAILKKNVDRTIFHYDIYVVKFSNVHCCDRSCYAIQSNLARKDVYYRLIRALL